MTQKKTSPLVVIFTTVLLDLVGFGMIIPLVGIYGRNFGASGVALGFLGAIFSLASFFSAPFWGSLSDRIGRRPVLLISLCGSTLSYFAFALAPNFEMLFLTRLFAGVFAGNIAAAQAYVADVTTREDRAKGMGMIGAAFGIGFTLGPPLGGIAAAKIGLFAPGLIAGTLCGLNAVLAFFRLPESLKVKSEVPMNGSHFFPLNGSRLTFLKQNPNLYLLYVTSFLVTFAFSNMEQSFSLFFQKRFSLDAGVAGLRTGLVLMFSGILGAVIQGGLIKKLTKRFSEVSILQAGLFFQVLGMLLFPQGTRYAHFFFLITPLAIGFALINPVLSSLVSKGTEAKDQGNALGLSQSFSALARAAGPFCGLTLFSVNSGYPFYMASLVTFGVIFLSLRLSKAALSRSSTL